MPQPKKYSYTADALRILAIIAVVTIHISGTFVNYPPYFGTTSWWFANSVDALCRPAVPLFIMLSGMLLLDVEKEVTYKNYYSKRLNRVGIPLLIWSGLYLLWQIYFWGNIYTPTKLFTVLFAPDIYYHLYFLYIILGLYIIGPFLRIIVQHISQVHVQISVAIAFGFVILLYAFNGFFKDLSISFNGLTLFLPYIPYFLAGHILWTKKITKHTFWWYVSGYVGFGILTAMLNFLYMKSIGWTNHITNSMPYDRYFYEHFSPNIVGMSLLGFVLMRNIPLLFPNTKTQRIQKGIRSLAPIVFGVYLVHLMIMDSIQRFIPVFDVTNISESSAWLIMLIEIILVVSLSFVVVALGKKIKFLSIIFG